MSFTISKYSLQKFGFYSVCFTCFSLQLSTTGIAIGSALFVLLWLCSGAAKDLPEILKTHLTAAISVLLFLLFLIGIFYSPAPKDVIVDTLKDYRILLYVPIVMCLCRNNKNATKYFINSFIAGSIVALTASYLLYFDLLPKSLSYNPSYNSILSPTPHSGFMALFTFLIVDKIFKKEMRPIYGLPLALLSTHNIFYVTGSSTGIVIFGVLSILLALKYLRYQYIAYAFFTSLILTVMIYVSSDKFSHEVDDVFTTLQHYEIGSGDMHNNVSLRLDWWLSSYWLMKQKPFFGHGTGSFEKVHDEIIKGTNIPPRHHPHNEYWYTGVQLGIVGLSVFIALMAVPFYQSFKQEISEKHALHAILIFFAIGNVFEGWLLGSATGKFFVLSIAALLAEQS